MDNKQNVELILPYDLLEMGFVRIKSYDHDDFFTNRYQRGPIVAELTSLNGILISAEYMIKETEYRQIEMSKLRQLVEVLVPKVKKPNP